MCGIGGIYRQQGAAEIELGALQQMAALMQHRGPDARGFFLDDQIGMAQVRLSIVDLAGGNQPMSNEDDSLWLVYNGEIYNHPELRAQLQRCGHVFRSCSDTEVLLHLYEQYGMSGIEQANGQFAFALWDRRRQQLFLARDRVGIRPLYFCQADGCLFFASEIKALLSDRRVVRQFDAPGLAQLFTFWSAQSPRTVFAGVQELPPGHWLEVDGSKLTSRRYWQIPLLSTPVAAAALPLRAADYAEQALYLLRDAVRLRLRADVPVGCYLSGGLDSSLVTALATAQQPAVTTFGLGFAAAEFDESVYQQCMCEFLGCAHQQYTVSNAGIGDALATVIWHCEQPLLRTAPVPMYLLSRLVHDCGYKVVLTGEGADEVFAGYNLFREAKVRRFWAQQPSSPWRPRLLAAIYPYIFTDPRLQHSLQAFYRRDLEQTSDPLFSHSVRWQNSARLKRLFSNDFAAGLGAYDALAELRACLPLEFAMAEPLAQAQYLEMTTFMSSYLLSAQGDRVAMANSVELRLPFLDFRLIEWMAAVPAACKLYGLQEKYLLRQMAQKLLPETIRRRPKQPYRAPIQPSLLQGQTAALVEELLQPASLQQSAVFDPLKAQRLLHKAKTQAGLSETDNMALIGVLSTQLLYRMFIAERPQASAAALPELPTQLVDLRSRAGTPRDADAGADIGISCKQ